MDSIDIVLNLKSEMIYEVGLKRIIAPKIHVNNLRSQSSCDHHHKLKLFISIVNE
jgi:hypothetical protein